MSYAPSPYIIRTGDALSQFFNVLLFNGHPNESISGRAYREGKPWRPWIDTLLWFDKKHCETAYINDCLYSADLLRQRSGGS